MEQQGEDNLKEIIRQIEEDIYEEAKQKGQPIGLVDFIGEMFYRANKRNIPAEAIYKYFHV